MHAYWGMNYCKSFFIQVTTHSHLLSQDEMKILEKSIDVEVVSFFLSEFDTEIDFLSKVG